MPYQIPYTFTAGEKAVAAEVNENFSSIANAINNLSEDLNAKILSIKSELNSSMNMKSFCFNSGPVDENGEAALLETQESTQDDILIKTLVLKSPAVYTDGFGATNTINEDLTLNISDLSEGEYSIRVSLKEGKFELTAIKDAKVTRDKKRPENPIIGDLFLDMSVMPQAAYKYTSENTWEASNEVEAGVLAITNSDNKVN